MRLLLLTSLLLLACCTTGLAQYIPVDSIQYTTNPDGSSPLFGLVVATGGIVTGVGYSGLATQYFISDRVGGPWHGILVRQNINNDPLLALGDSVHFRAEVDENNTQTRLRNFVDGTFARIAAVTQVEPFRVSTGAVGEALEGVLIEVNNVGVTSVSFDIFIVDDGTGPLTVGRGWSYNYAPSVGDTLRNIRGLVTSAANVFALNPRGDFDLGFVANRPPVISSVLRSPLSPRETESDTVTAMITDDQQVAMARLFYRFQNMAEFSVRAMNDDGVNGDAMAGDNIWTGIIPPGAARAWCAYYLTAADDSGLVASFPPGAPQVTDSFYVRSAIISIFDLQYTGNVTGGNSPYADQTVSVVGIVTGTNFGSLRTACFVSDPGGGPWSGIFVFGPSLTPAIGDSVRVEGRVKEYNGLTEFDNGTQVSVLGAGAVPPPIDVRIGVMRDSAEVYEGCLVRIGPCVCSAIDEWVEPYPAFEVRDATGTCVIIKDTDFEYAPAVGDSFTYIIGCVKYYSRHGWEIAPRSDEDLGVVDRRPPVLLSVAVVGEHLINVQFNERLADTEDLANPLNYLLIDQTDQGTPELHIVSGSLFSTGRTIHIEVLESLIDTHAYRLQIHRVQDIAGNFLEGAATTFYGYRPGDYTPIRTLYDSLAAYTGRVVSVRGVVNFVQDVTTTSGSRRISAFMQDESGRGINLSQSGPASQFPGIQRGNLIVLQGQCAPYQGALQLSGFNGSPASGDIVVLAENQPLPEPIRLKTGDRRLQRELVRTSDPANFGSGTWCEVTGTIYRVDENIGGGTNIQIDDGTGNIIIRVWDSMHLDSVWLEDRGYRLRDLVGVRCTVRGPSSTYRSDFQMLAGYAADFSAAGTDTTLQGAGDFVLEVPNRPFAPDLGQTLPIAYKVPPLSEVRLRIFNLRGQLVTTLVDKPGGGPNLITWDGRDELRELLPLGTYILHLEAVSGGTTKSKVKPIVIGTRL